MDISRDKTQTITKDASLSIAPSANDANLSMRFKRISTHLANNFANSLVGAAMLVGAGIHSGSAAAQTASQNNDIDHSNHIYHGAVTNFTFRNYGENPEIPLAHSLICAENGAFYTAQNTCYGLYAQNVKDYAASMADPYLSAQNIQSLAEMLQTLEPSDIKIDETSNTVTATFKNESGLLHNAKGPSYIKVNLEERSYLEMRHINGNFYSTANSPSFVKYIENSEARVHWDSMMGRHNPYGPSYTYIDLRSNQMDMEWALNGITDTLDMEVGLTFSKVNLDTNIAYFRETATGTILEGQRRMHRSDGLHVTELDPVTGADKYRIYRHHGMEANSDEISIEYFYDVETGAIAREVWAKNGREIPKIENYTPPVMDHSQHYMPVTPAPLQP